MGLIYQSLRKVVCNSHQIFKYFKIRTQKRRWSVAKSHSGHREGTS